MPIPPSAMSWHHAGEVAKQRWQKELIELNLYSNGSREGSNLLEGMGNDGGTIGACREFLQKDELETRKMEGRTKE